MVSTAEKMQELAAQYMVCRRIKEEMQELAAQYRVFRRVRKTLENASKSEIEEIVYEYETTPKWKRGLSNLNDLFLGVMTEKNMRYRISKIIYDGRTIDWEDIEAGHRKALSRVANIDSYPEFK